MSPQPENQQTSAPSSKPETRRAAPIPQELIKTLLEKGPQLPEITGNENFKELVKLGRNALPAITAELIKPGTSPDDQTRLIELVKSLPNKRYDDVIGLLNKGAVKNNKQLYLKVIQALGTVNDQSLPEKIFKNLSNFKHSPLTALYIYSKRFDAERSVGEKFQKSLSRNHRDILAYEDFSTYAPALLGSTLTSDFKNNLSSITSSTTTNDKELGKIYRGLGDNRSNDSFESLKSLALDSNTRERKHCINALASHRRSAAVGVFKKIIEEEGVGPLDKEMAIKALGYTSDDHALIILGSLASSKEKPKEAEPAIHALLMMNRDEATTVVRNYLNQASPAEKIPVIKSIFETGRLDLIPDVKLNIVSLSSKEKTTLFGTFNWKYFPLPDYISLNREFQELILSQTNEQDPELKKSLIKIISIMIPTAECGKVLNNILESNADQSVKIEAAKASLRFKDSDLANKGFNLLLKELKTNPSSEIVNYICSTQLPIAPEVVNEVTDAILVSLGKTGDQDFITFAILGIRNIRGHKGVEKIKQLYFEDQAFRGFCLSALEAISSKESLGALEEIYNKSNDKDRKDEIRKILKNSKHPKSLELCKKLKIAREKLKDGDSLFLFSKRVEDLSNDERLSLIRQPLNKELNPGQSLILLESLSSESNPFNKEEAIKKINSLSGADLQIFHQTLESLPNTSKPLANYLLLENKITWLSDYLLKKGFGEDVSNSDKLNSIHYLLSNDTTKLNPDDAKKIAYPILAKELERLVYRDETITERMALNRNISRFSALLAPGKNYSEFLSEICKSSNNLQLNEYNQLLVRGRKLNITDPTVFSARFFKHIVETRERYEKELETGPDEEKPIKYNAFTRAINDHNGAFFEARIAFEKAHEEGANILYFEAPDKFSPWVEIARSKPLALQIPTWINFTHGSQRVQSYGLWDPAGKLPEMQEIPQNKERLTIADKNEIKNELDSKGLNLNDASNNIENFILLSCLVGAGRGATENITNFYRQMLPEISDDGIISPIDTINVSKFKVVDGVIVCIDYSPEDVPTYLARTKTLPKFTPPSFQLAQFFQPQLTPAS